MVFAHFPSLTISTLSEEKVYSRFGEHGAEFNYNKILYRHLIYISNRDRSILRPYNMSPSRSQISLSWLVKKSATLVI